MNSLRPNNAMLPAQPSLWRRAPAWRNTLVMAVLATTAAASLFVGRNAAGPQQTVPASPLAPVVVVPASPPTVGNGVVAQATATDKSFTAPVRADSPVAQLTDNPTHKQDARVIGPAPRPAERVVAKAPKPVLREEPGPVKKQALAAASVPEIAAPKSPASPMVQSSEANSACPNLARIIPFTEPRYNHAQVVAVRSAEVSANTTQRSLVETGASVDVKYQYQIHAVLGSKVPQSRNGQEIHIAAVIPPDLRVQPGDIVAWDGAYRDVPGTCHYVPARIRAVLSHAELPPAPTRSEGPTSPAVLAVPNS